MTRFLSIWMLCALTLSVLGSPAAAKKPQLVMFEQWGCEWCEVWTEEIGHILPKTAEGRS